MKRILTVLCTLAVLMAGSAPALAADAASDPCYYPIAVEEYTAGDSNELRISKVYQLSLSDDPSLIPTGDFERGGRTYTLLDMTRKDEVGVDIQPHTETVTQPSDTNDLEKILQALDAEREVTTEDGYAGTLRLDHTSVQVAADGYKTSTRTLSATRSYPRPSPRWLVSGHGAGARRWVYDQGTCHAGVLCQGRREQDDHVQECPEKCHNC